MNHVAAFILRLAAGRAMEIMAWGRDLPVDRWSRVLAFPVHRQLADAADNYAP